MIRLALVVTGAVLFGQCAFGQYAFDQCAFGQTAGVLEAPGDYSFAPVPSTNGVGHATGEVSAFVGSRATSGAAIQLQGDLLGHGGLHGFAAFGTATGRDRPIASAFPAPRVTRRSGAIGLEKSFLSGTTLSIGGSWTDSHLPRGRYTPALP